MKTLKITILSLVLSIPSILLSQNNNVIKVMRYKSDTSTTPYEITYYVAKDTLNGVIYIPQKKLTDTMVKTKRLNKTKIVKRRNKRKSDV
jgi:hypothetical protein